MVALSAVGKVPARAQGCVIDITVATRVEFVRGQGEVLYLYRVEILTYGTADLPKVLPPGPGIPDCLQIAEYLLPADVDPSRAVWRPVCRYEPPPRGHAQERLIRIWFLIPVDAGVRSEDIPPDVHCWELTRHLGPPRGAETFPVPCVLN